MRNERVWPHLDDKILVSWNGLMIGSLAYGGRHLNAPGYTEAARNAADFILATMRKDDRLLRTYRAGRAKVDAYLDDYSFLADGLVELYEATEDKRWLKEAKALVEVLLKDYRDEEGGGFFFTSREQPNLLVRSKDPFDGALPSGNGVAARVLVRLGRLTGEKRYLEAAKGTLEAFRGAVQQAPRGTESLSLAAAMYFDERPPTVLTKEAEESAPPEAEPDARVRKEPVTAEAFASRVKVMPGETFHIAVRLTIDDGWHINSNRPLQDHLIPTALCLRESGVVALGEVVYPPGKSVNLAFTPEPFSVWERQIWIRAPVTVTLDAPACAATVVLEIHAQACSDKSCLLPETLSLSIPLEIDPEAGPNEIRHKHLFDSLGVVGAGSCPD